MNRDHSSPRRVVIPHGQSYNHRNVKLSGGWKVEETNEIVRRRFERRE